MIPHSKLLPHRRLPSTKARCLFYHESWMRACQTVEIDRSLIACTSRNIINLEEVIEMRDSSTMTDSEAPSPPCVYSSRASCTIDEFLMWFTARSGYKQAVYITGGIRPVSEHWVTSGTAFSSLYLTFRTPLNDLGEVVSCLMIAARPWRTTPSVRQAGADEACWKCKPKSATLGVARVLLAWAQCHLITRWAFWMGSWPITCRR